MRLHCDPAEGLCYENWGVLQKVFTLYSYLDAYVDVGENAALCGVLSEPSILFAPMCVKSHHINSKET